MFEQHKRELEKAMMEMFEQFHEMDNTKVFFSETSIKQALEEYGYVEMWDAYSESMEDKSPENPATEKMFMYSQRVAEITFHETLEEMSQRGMGDYGVDKNGELTFILNEKGKKVRNYLDK